MSDVLVLNSSGEPLSLVPLSTVTWQTALKLVFADKAKVLKTYDDWVVHSQYLTINVPSVVIVTEHVRWNRHLKYNRINVYLRDNFTCQLQITNKCKSVKGKVDVDELTLDHVVPRVHGGKNTWTNTCTSCKDCNGEKGSDKNIVPKILPKKPSYYEILAKRKSLPLCIHDEDWKNYIPWPEHLLEYVQIQRK